MNDSALRKVHIHRVAWSNFETRLCAPSTKAPRKASSLCNKVIGKYHAALFLIFFHFLFDRVENLER